MLTKLGWNTRVTTPAEFAAFVAADAKKWPSIVKAAGLKAD
jgi:tripartite-type tricarboxylate transporter receptor subunit TctC